MFRPTTEQLEVIEHRSGHALVRAVAGSGKSATLVERIARLVESGVQLDEILVLMFNKSAADDFRARLSRRLPDGAPEVFTFHSFGMRLARRLSCDGALPHARLVSSTAESRQFARQVLSEHFAEHGDEPQDLSNEALDEYLSAIDMLKGALYTGGPLPGWASDSSRLLSSFKRFEARRRSAGMRFFADLIYDPVLLSRIDAGVRAALADAYGHVLVDEFQDINDAQMEMVRTVAGERASVMVVGDDDQTIYGWRGARPEFMLSLFEKQFPGVKSYSLTGTFRYGHALSLLANACIANNTMRAEKLCVSRTEQSTRITVRMHTHGPADLAVEEIRAWVDEGRQLNEIAILVREYANAIGVEIALQRHAIPARIVGAASFAEQAEVLVLRGYMSLAGGNAAVWDPAGAEKIIAAMLGTPTLYLKRAELSRLLSPGVPLSRTLRQMSAGAKSWLAQIRAKTADAMDWASRQSPDAPAAPFLLEIIRRVSLFEHIHRAGIRKDRIDERCRMIRQVIELAREHQHTVASLRELMREIVEAQEDAQDSVLITSVHRSKGLEWPCVLLPDLAEGQFPAQGSPIEDERRLYYVATTRARERLVLIAPLDRGLVEHSKHGRTGSPAPGGIKASRFLFESNLIVASQVAEQIANGAIDQARAGLTADAGGTAIVEGYLCALGHKR
jgi:DNA helicase-2/ATP-dependent DNA helicase PcrA